MSKQKWKLKNLSYSLIKSKIKNKIVPTLDSNNNLKDPSVIIWDRNSIIPSFLNGAIALVHNGREFKPIKINQEKIGYKFGEFSETRKPNIYKGKKKVIKKK